MSRVPAVLHDALEELADRRAEPDTLALFDALHFLVEALEADEGAAERLAALARLMHATPDPLGVAVLAALGHGFEEPQPDPLAPLLQAAGLPVGDPEPLAALQAWATRQQHVIQVQRERLAHAERLLSRARQVTHLAAATVVVLLGVVVLLLVVEGGWIEVPEADHTPVGEPVPEPVERPPEGRR